MVLWVILIHAVELLGIGIYLLIRKNSILEKTIVEQQQFMDAMGVLISNSEEKLRELDQTGALQSDDEIGHFFRNLKEIQNIIGEFNSYRK